MTREQDNYIKYRLQRASDTLNDAKLLAENERWNSSINRLYYAIVRLCGYVEALWGKLREDPGRSEYPDHSIRSVVAIMKFRFKVLTKEIKTESAIEKPYNFFLQDRNVFYDDAPYNHIINFIVPMNDPVS